MASGSESALLTRISAQQWDDVVAKLFTADVAEVRPRRWERLYLGAGIATRSIGSTAPPVCRPARASGRWWSRSSFSTRTRWIRSRS
jgi:hypothetical protein